MWRPSPAGSARILCLSALLVSPALPGGASPVPRFQTLARGVAAEALGDNSQRKLVVDRRGGLLLVYVRPEDGIDQIVLAQSSDGGRTWRHVQITRGPHPARLPSLAVFPDGSVHLVWTEYAPLGRVLYRVERGGRWGKPLALSAAGLYAGVPVVAPFQGRPHVLWYGIRPERPVVRTRHGSTYEILSTRQEAGGWTAPEVISAGIPDSINPSLDAAADGSLHAVWYQFDARVYQVRYARFDGGWSPPRSLTTGAAEHTRVALDAEGGEVHLVWQEQGARRRVMYRTPGTTPTALSASGPIHDPVVAAQGRRLAAAWGQGGVVVFRQVRPWGAVRVLGEGVAPALAIAGDTAHVVWTRAEGAATELRYATVVLH